MFADFFMLNINITCIRPSHNSAVTSVVLEEDLGCGHVEGGCVATEELEC